VSLIELEKKGGQPHATLSMKLWPNTPVAKLSQPRVESDAERGVPLYVPASANKLMAWMRTNKAVFLMILLVAVIALVPLYGILFPPLVDLPEHILMSKLLWEKLSGISHLDLEVSTFLGYRLFPALMVIVIPFCKLCGISFVYLPKIAAMALISLHAIVIVTILYFGLKDKSWKSCALAACFSVPAVVCMYSACWFIGFVNYTLAITLLIPAIFLTERFLRSGKLLDAFLLFLTLCLTYTAHPFAPTFWLLWCFSRSLAGIFTLSVLREWKRWISLGLIFLPVVLYHFLATRGTQLAPASISFRSQSPFVSITGWRHNRLPALLSGYFFQADDAADSGLFVLVALGLILFATVLAFCTVRNRHVKTVMLSTVFLFVVSSWINEKFFPVPPGFWLAYDYRYSSTVYAICLALSGMVIVQLLPVSIGAVRGRIIFAPLAFLSVFASMAHLVEVRRAYTRFDAPARKYMAKIFSYEQPVGITMPHSRYGLDGTFLKEYICLEEPDCVPAASTFAIFSKSGFSGNLYPVTLKSASKVVSARELVRWRERVPKGPLVGYWKLDEPNRSDACLDSSGNENTGKAKGTGVVDGKINRARSFNGNAADYIDIPPINISNAITVSAWVYSDNFVQNGFVVTKNPVNTQWALFFDRSSAGAANGLLKWRGVGAESNIACPVPSSKTWHHIVGRQEGTAASLYVDGVLCASGPLPAIGNAASWISIGRYDSPDCYFYFNGQIDEVRIYNRALSDTEISQLFTASDSRPSSSSTSNAQAKL
jgi:Concanavalin A-like lectin/glucanases superfamily